MARIVSSPSFRAMILGRVFKLTKQVDDAIVVTGKKSNKISKKEHKGSVDDAVIQVGGCDVEIQ